VGYRQALYLGFIGVSVVGTALTVGLSHLLNRSAWAPAKGWVRWLAAAAFDALYAVAIYAALPANPDPIAMPADLLWTFRVISFVGLMLFWVIFAGMFGWFARDTSPALGHHGGL
jgi:hypothetical protein